MSTDKEFMKIAIELSKKADQPYGSIVVRKDKIIGRSDTDTNIKKSMFKHAQMIAIEDALKNISTTASIGDSSDWKNSIRNQYITYK
jgi:tRNA(Arg) A34 adenosine deaminase TadA